MRKKNYVRTTLLLLLSLLLGGPTLASAPEASLDFQIKYGILKQVGPEKFVVVKETTNIPFITRKEQPGFMFGYIVTSKVGDFVEYSRLTSPVPARSTGNAVHYGEIKDGKLVVSSQKTRWPGHMYSVLQLDEGDPKGEYKFEVFINNVLFRTLVFQVGNGG